MSERLEHLGDLPPDEQLKVFREVVDAMPHDAFSDCTRELAELAEELENGRSLPAGQVRDLLARVYSGYAKILHETSEQLSPHDEEEARNAELVARGYALLAEGTRGASQFKLMQGMDLITQVGDKKSRSPKASELLRQEVTAERLEGMEAQLQKAAAHIEDDEWEDEDPYIEGVRAYRSALDAAWKYLEDRDPATLDEAVNWMVEAEGLLEKA